MLEVGSMGSSRNGVISLFRRQTAVEATPLAALANCALAVEILK